MQFDPEIARTCAELCHISYYDVQREHRAYQRIYNKQKYGGFGLRNFNVFNAQDDSELCFAASRTHGDAYIVFRGTPNQQKIGILSYLFTWPFYSRERNGKAHTKFVRALDKVWPQLHSYFEYRATRTGKHPLIKRIIWTGHSAGGALAILAAARFNWEFKTSQPQHCVYTFGQPRVGGAEFWNRFDKYPVFRFIHGNDIVPRLPPPLPGFRHRGNLIHGFAKKGDWEIQFNPDFRQRLKTFWHTGIRRWDFISSLKRDHYTDKYMELADNL